MHWEDIPATVDRWTEKISAFADDLKMAAAGVITASPVGYYADPETDRIGVFAPQASGGDVVRVKNAAVRGTGSDPVFLSYQQLEHPAATWVKVAYSPTLHRAGELLNFFPGQYPGGIPNAPSPIAAMLTSGLVGAGLGWGAGKAIGSTLPPGYGKKLGRTGAILGGLAGAIPGAVWGGVNTRIGRGFNDPTVFDAQAGGEPVSYEDVTDGTNALKPLPHGGNSELLDQAREALHNAPLKFGADTYVDVPLGALYKQAVEKVADTFGVAEPDYGHSPLDVNIDHLGRTLWDTGAPPALAASTMAGMYAAQQLPDRNSRPGWVTGNQLGQLAARAAGDYGKGALVGAAINAVVGTPFRSSTFGTANAVLGILGTVVPKLFGG